MIAAFFEGLAEFVVRFRVAVVVFWVIVTAVAMLALPALGSEVNSDPSLFLSPGAKSVEAAALGTPLLGRSDRSKVTVVAARADAPLTSADLAALDREGKLARGVAGVDSVRPGAVSPDGKAVEIDVSVSKEAKDVAGLKPVVTAIQRTFAEAAAPPGLQLHLAGNVATNVANNTSTNKATRKIGYLSILFIVVLLMIVLRSPVAALVTFLPSVAALLLSQKLIAGLGASGLQISSVTQTLLVVLMLGAGTDYGLFLVYRFREELEAGTEPRLAVVRALTRVGESITASAGTVILALLTLLLASFGLYHDLGLPLAIGIAVMLLAGLTLLPALLALAAPLMFAGRAPRRGVEGGSSPLGQAQFAGLAPRDRAGRGEGLWGRVAARAVRRPGLTLGAGALIFAALALAAFGYRTAGLNRSTTAPAGSDAAAGNALVAEYFPQSAVSPADLILHYATPAWQSPGPLTVAQASLRSSGLFSTLAGPLDPNGAPLSPAAYAAAHAELGSPKGLPLTEPANIRLPRGVYNAYRATAQYVSADGRTVRFAAGLRAGDQQSSGAMNATPAVRAAVTAAARRSGAEVSGVTGQAAALYDVSAVAGSDLMRIIPVAVLAIAVLLGARPAQPGRAALPGGQHRRVLPGRARRHDAPGHRPRRSERADLHPAVPDVRVPARARRGLQHPGHDPDQGGGPAPAAARGRGPGHREDRAHGHLGRPHPGGHLRRVCALAGGGAMGGQFQSIGLRSRARHPAGHLRGQDAARAVRGRPARPRELVAVAPGPGRPADGARRTRPGLPG